MKVIDKVAWIHLEDGRALCCRSHGKALFYFPGGKREPGENDAACLARELEEELSVELEHDSLEHLGSFEAPADGAPDVLLRMACYRARVLGQPRPCAEIAELAWLSPDDRDKTSVMGRIVLQWLADKGLMAPDPRRIQDPADPF